MPSISYLRCNWNATNYTAVMADGQEVRGLGPDEVLTYRKLQLALARRGVKYQDNYLEDVPRRHRAFVWAECLAALVHAGKGTDTAAREEAENETVNACRWLVDRFREKPEWRSEELFEAGRAAQIGRKAIFAAKAKLGLPRARYRTDETGRRWFAWWIPTDSPLLASGNNNHSLNHQGK
jgi:hypothetical protein